MLRGGAKDRISTKFDVTFRNYWLMGEIPMYFPNHQTNEKATWNKNKEGKDLPQKEHHHLGVSKNRDIPKSSIQK